MIYPKRIPASSIPKVSIVMAAYNEAKHIGRAIDSILAQTFTDWELIVIDDGSTEATADIVRRYADKDRRIVLICNEKNIKLPASLNKGIKVAKANLIARADADDVNLCERLSMQYAFMKKHHNVDVLGTGAYLLDGKGNRVGSISLPQKHVELEKLPFLKTHFVHPTVMIRKRFFDTIGGYDPTYLRAQDKELWLRGLAKLSVYANLPEPLVEYSTGGYVRSWMSILNRVLSLCRMVRAYNIKDGYKQIFLSAAYSVSIKLKIYRPKSLRQIGISKI